MKDNVKKWIIALVAVLVVAVGAVVVIRTINNNARQQENSSEVQENNNTPVSDEIVYDGVDGKTALELLKEKYEVKTQEYTGMGEFVTGIDGKQADDTHFWAFYVNGMMAEEGAGTYGTKAGEKIEWKLEEIVY